MYESQPALLEKWESHQATPSGTRAHHFCKFPAGGRRVALCRIIWRCGSGLGEQAWNRLWASVGFDLVLWCGEKLVPKKRRLEILCVIPPLFPSS